MARVVILGSACAVSDERHEHTYFALAGRHDIVLVDCAGQPLTRLRRAGLDFEQVSDVVLTHFHPDHVHGLPVLIVEMWLSGRRHPLQVHGLPHCTERMAGMMDAYGWQDWSQLYPVSFHALAEGENTRVLQTDDFRITASPVRHLLPALGLRVEDKATGGTLAYSGDTEPCSEMMRLAQGADLLIHEATGEHRGHSSAAQAGQAARLAGAKRLALIHYEVGRADPAPLVVQAAETFGGPVTLAEDFMELEF
jgi:ribonuclease Z